MFPESAKVMSGKPSISATEKFILTDLQKRSSVSLKSSLDTETYSYRQYLRIIDKMIDNNFIRGWVPVFHPFFSTYKKMVWFFLRTNPRDPQDLVFLQSLGGQLLSLEGVAGPYSLLALIQFNSDQDFNSSLATIDEHFSTPNPIYQNIRYQYLEIIAFYKYNGFTIENDYSIDTSQSLSLKEALLQAGIQKKRPPTTDEIASYLHVSNSTVQKQIKQLEGNNSILGYSISLNPILQPSVKAIVQFHVHPGKYSEAIEVLTDDIHTTLVCKIQKESFNLLAVVFAQTIPDLNIWLTNLYTIEGLLDTLTTVVLKNEQTYNFNEHFPIL